MNNEYTESELDKMIELVQKMKEELALSEKHRKEYERLKQELNKLIKNSSSVQNKNERQVWNASQLTVKDHGKKIKTSSDYYSVYNSPIPAGIYTVDYDDGNFYFESTNSVPVFGRIVTDRKDIEFTFVDEE